MKQPLRIVIAGGPRTGKTTLALVLDRGAGVTQTDDLIPGAPWSEQSAQACELMEKPGPWIIEGTTTVRALRRFLAQHPAPEKPCDLLVWMDQPQSELTAGQHRMAKGCLTILNQIEKELADRGVTISRPQSHRHPNTGDPSP